MTSTLQTVSNFNGNAGESRPAIALRRSTAKASAGWLIRGFAMMRDLAPYAAIELLLPGGSLMALGLWFLRRKARRKTSMRTNASVGGAVAHSLENCCALNIG